MTTISGFVKKMIADFCSLKPDCDLKTLAEMFGGCTDWLELDRVICEFMVHRQPMPISDNQRGLWPTEAVEAMEGLRRKRESERQFWEGKREEIAELSEMRAMTQPPLTESVLEPLKEVNTGRLTRLQKEKLEVLTNNPGIEEFEFFKRLIGLTPALAGRAMAEEYLGRFKPDFTPAEVIKRLSPGRTWTGLDLGIKRFLKFRRENLRLKGPSFWANSVSAGLSVDLSLEYNLELDFWDKMRHLIYSLPKPREFRSKYQKQADLAKTPPAEGWHYATCELCWRMVHYNPASKQSSILCFEHDQPSNNKLYRKHRRLEKDVLCSCFEISKRLKPWRDMGMSDTEEQTALIHLMTSPESPMPSLVEHLKSQGHDGTPESLLRAFHGPFEKMIAPYRKAMEKFIQIAICEQPFITAFEICLAEAWLALLHRDLRRKNSELYE